MKNLSLTLVFLLLICSCSKIETGDLEVTVNYRSSPIADQPITLRPNNITKNSNEEGKVIFSSLEEGDYSLLVNSSTFGGLIKDVQIFENERTEIVLDLDPRLTMPATVEIYRPEEGETFKANLQIPFVVALETHNGSPELYSYELSSNLNGLLSTGMFGQFGSFQIFMENLQIGAHSLTIKVTDPDGFEIEQTVNFEIAEEPESIELSLDSSPKFINKIKWEYQSNQNFDSYRIYRNNPPSSSMNLVKTIEDPSISFFEDDDILIDREYVYRVDVYEVNGLHAESNVVTNSVQAPFVQFPSNIIKLVYDSERNAIYACARNDDTVYKVDVETAEITDELNQFGSPTDMEFSGTSRYLYVPNSSRETISAIDLDNFTVAFSHNTIPWNNVLEDRPTSVAFMDGLGVAYDQAGWGWLTLLDGNGNLIARADFQFTGDEIFSIPGESYVLANDEDKVLKYELISGDLTITSETTLGLDTPHVSFSGDYKYMFTGRHKHFVSNIGSNLGGFDEIVYGANYDGSLAFSKTHVWDAESFQIMRKMPVVSSVMTLSADGETLFLFDESNKKLFFINLECL